jgi:hypothetical protein
MTQFMMFTAMPVTALYQDLKARGLLDFDLPYAEWHGQHELNWRHPHFSSAEARRVLGDAFRQEYDRNSTSVLRMAQTALRGLATLQEPARTDPWLAIRRDQIRTYAQKFRLLLPTLACFAHNPVERRRVAELGQAFQQVLGPMTLNSRAWSMGALSVAWFQTLRTALSGGMAQPGMRLTRYRWPGPASGFRAWLGNLLAPGSTRKGPVGAAVPGEPS